MARLIPVPPFRVLPPAAPFATANGRQTNNIPFAREVGCASCVPLPLYPQARALSLRAFERKKSHLL
jgi:hypothetical protein